MLSRSTSATTSHGTRRGATGLGYESPEHRQADRGGKFTIRLQLADGSGTLAKEHFARAASSQRIMSLVGAQQEDK
jgi:hypothetical protein